MIEYQKINISINFVEGSVKEDRLPRATILSELEAHLFNLLNERGIQQKEVSITMSTEEKIRSEILYEDGLFRILKTRTCNALLQIKKEDRDGSFSWKDCAYYGCGEQDECIIKAKEEILRLMKKNAKFKKAVIKIEKRQAKEKKIRTMTPEQLALFAQLVPKDE
jgi:hypothetical protein